MIIEFQVPLKTVSELNKREHWLAAHKRHKNQKMIVTAYLRKYANLGPVPFVSAKVTLTRISPRILDSHDNLPASLKYIVDAIAEYLVPGKATGRADDDIRILWEYQQEKGVGSVKIHIELNF